MNHYEINPSSTDEDETESDLTTTAKKKKASQIVSSLLEIKNDENPKASQAPMTLTEALLYKREPQKEPDNPLDNSHEQAIDLSHEELTPEEILASAIVFRQEARIDRQASAPDDDLSVIIHQKLDEYDSKIIEDGLHPDQAFQEILADNQLELADKDKQIELHPVEETDIDETILIADLVSPDNNQPKTTEPIDTSLKEPIASNSDGGGGNKLPPNINPEFMMPDPDNQGNRFDTVPQTSDQYNSRQSANKINSERKYKTTREGIVVTSLVEYYLAKRRERLKTEKKIKKVENKLEKQVNELKDKLATQDQTIRRLVSDKYAKVPERPNTTIKPNKIETIKRPNKINGFPEKHLGQLVVLDSPKPKSITREVSTPKTADIATMPKEQLLNLSEKIKVDNSDLRQVYETHLISEQALRRLASEYFKGGNIKKALKHEITERQIDFERDPIMRDLPNTPTTTSGISSQSSLESMIKRVEANFSNSQEEAFLKAQAVLNNQSKKATNQPFRVINSIFIVIITILITVIVLLIISRR